MASAQIWIAPLAAAALLAAGTDAMAQDANEAPLGLVLEAAKASIVRSASLTPLSAKPGSILFAGDRLVSSGGAITFISCLGSLQQTLSEDGDVLFEARGPRLRSGRFTAQTPGKSCFLPAMPRNVVASRQDAGAAVAREISRDFSGKTFAERLELLPPEKRGPLNAALAPVDAALRSNPADPLRHLAKAELLNRYGMVLDAAEEMKPVIEAWPDAGWARSERFRLQEDAARGVQVNHPDPISGGNTYALLVGISKFRNSGVASLQFAHADAIELTNLLESPRAGGVPASNVVLLVNEQATRGAIQAAIETHLLARAGKNDTVILFIASHGASVQDQGYIVAYDSDPNDLALTGLPMEDIKDLFEERLSGVKRLLLYVDVCHAGKIGEIEPKADLINKSAEHSLAQPDMFGMLASQSKQVAIESADFGGGHGAFSYFLMSALNGEADLDHTGKVTMDQLSLYVQNEVSAATLRKQNPKQIGDVDNTVMALLEKPGIGLAPYTGRQLNRQFGSAPLTASSPLYPQERSVGGQSAAELVRQFEEAVQAGRILPTDGRGAFPILASLRNALSAAEYQKESEKLRVALEDEGQQVLVQYLAGEALPQQRGDFLRGSQYFEAAESLTPDSVYLQSRAFFCQGRAAIFDKDYDRATTLLERAVGLDPQRAYSYNALGIAYLERADYDRAILAFRDAANRAPYWAYPLHNMALSFAEKGDYEDAIRTYRRAMQLAPDAVYLPYNLGLLYQRTNRSGEASKLYAQALKLDPGNARAWNAMGSIQTAAGKAAEAERLYLQALKLDPQLLPARYNLATLLSADPKRAGQALALWRENLSRDPKDMASRVALAGFLAQQGSYADAAREYELALAERPDYLAARLALAGAEIEAGRPADALANLQQALQSQPENPDILERTAQTYAALGRGAEAKAAYARALQFASGRSARKRIQAASSKLQ